MNDALHEIQKFALKKLSQAKRCQYSELKPANVESNKFAYHLRCLTKNGMVTLKNGSYSLTPKGKHFVDTVSFESFKPRIQPKIVTLLVIEKKDNDKGGKKSAGDKNADGGTSYAMYKRRRSPFINHIGFPYGKIHLEERLYEAAERELQEKTGLSAKLEHRGDVYITVHDETELVSHMFCHVFSASNPTGTLKTDDPCGECFWARLENIPQKQLIPGVPQILKLLRESDKKAGGKNGKGKKHRERFFGEYFLNTSDEE